MVNERAIRLFAATILTVTAAVGAAEAEGLSGEDWQALKKVIAAAQEKMLPRALEACRTIDPVSKPESCAPTGFQPYGASDPSVIYAEYQCRMRHPDPSRGAYTLRVQLPVSLAKRDGVWTASPVVFASIGGEAPPEDQFQRGAAPPVRTRGPVQQAPVRLTFFQRVFNSIQPTMIWWPESFGTLVLGGLILYVTWGGGARRQGVRGSLTMLNIATGLTGGFILGLALWHSIPPYILYGGRGGSTPLYLYLILPAPLGALTAVVSWILLGYLWSVIQKQRVRFVPLTLVSLQIAFCLFTLNVIIKCVLPR